MLLSILLLAKRRPVLLQEQAWQAYKRMGREKQAEIALP
jgi:hypothetical protein